MIAVLFCYVPSTEKTMSQVIDWGDNPIDQAWALKASLEDDWPGAIWSVGADEEAKRVTGLARMKALLGPDWEPTT